MIENKFKRIEILIPKNEYTINEFILSTHFKNKEPTRLDI